MDLPIILPMPIVIPSSPTWLDFVSMGANCVVALAAVAAFFLARRELNLQHEAHKNETQRHHDAQVSACLLGFKKYRYQFAVSTQVFVKANELLREGISQQVIVEALRKTATNVEFVQAVSKWEQEPGVYEGVPLVIPDPHKG